MVISSQLIELGTLLITFIGIWIAIAQIRSGGRDSRASRLADMSWQIYQAYTDPELREARADAEHIAHGGSLPSSGLEYGELYANKEFQKADNEQYKVDRNIRKLLRFYSQVGILLEKKLADKEMIFELIGPGLNSTWPILSLAIEWYQKYGRGAIEVSQVKKYHRYGLVTRLYDSYLAWVSTLEVEKCK